MASRIERLLNLLSLFMGAERPVTADRVREMVPGYPDDRASFQRQFERDKTELRDMGMPLETIEIPGTYPVVVGYRIRRDQAVLRDPGLEPDELAAMRLAASAVRLEGIEGSGGLWKLGGEVDLDGVAAPAPGPAALPADERLFALFSAVAERRLASFGYGGVARQVDPWRLDCTRGRWYATGHDHTRGDTRHFRVERIEGSVELGPPGAFERPTGTVEGVRMEAWRFADAPAVTARLLVDADHVAEARAAAPSARVAETRDDGAAVLEIEVSEADGFRSLVLGFLEHAEVLGPAELRDDVVAWLTGIAGTAAGGPA